MTDRTEVVTRPWPDDGVGPGEMQRMLGEVAADLYDFDLEALAPLARKYGPTVDELAQSLDRLPDGPKRGDQARRRSFLAS